MELADAKHAHYPENVHVRCAPCEAAPPHTPHSSVAAHSDLLSDSSARLPPSTPSAASPVPLRISDWTLANTRHHDAFTPPCLHTLTPMHRTLHTCTLHLYTSPLYDRTTSSSASSEGTPTRCPRHARLTSPSSTTGESAVCGVRCVRWVGGLRCGRWVGRGRVRDVRVGGRKVDYCTDSQAGVYHSWTRVYGCLLTFLPTSLLSLSLSLSLSLFLSLSSPSISPVPLLVFSSPSLAPSPSPYLTTGRSSVWTPSGHD